MAITTHVFHVEGVHCGSWARLIDDALEDLPGVRSTRTTMKKGGSTVELDLIGAFAPSTLPTSCPTGQ